MVSASVECDVTVLVTKKYLPLPASGYGKALPEESLVTSESESLLMTACARKAGRGQINQHALPGQADGNWYAKYCIGMASHP